MSEVLGQVDKLSPERFALLQKILRQRTGTASEPDAILPREGGGPAPLSFAQERLWFLHQMEPQGAGYNMPWPTRLRGALDAGALERALGELVSRHEALRTTFRAVEQGAVQVVHPAAPAHLPVLDLTGLAPQDREDEARRLMREDAERPFDLERGPLLRATLLRLSGEEHLLLLTVHHIVSDGWSMGVLFRELFTLYESLSRPSGAASPESPLPPLAVQYADFAVWQRGWLRGEVLRSQIDWWRERLGGAPPALELPTDRPRPAVASSRGAAHVFRIPAEITRGLHSLARREGATLYMVAHAALDLLLSRWSGQEDLVVGSPIAGRTKMGTEGLIGFFVNTLALRIDLSGDPSFQELVRRVRETALGAYAHQDLPFERLVEEVAPERGLSHTPLFQVMFALQNANTGERPAIAGLGLEPFGGEIRTVHFDVELDLGEVGEDLMGILRFRTDLFDAATMERFAAQYGVVLAAAVASPEERLSRLAILPAEEARTLLTYGSGPARGDAGGAPVHRLFAAQAARTPEAPALLFAGESLSYAELDAYAGRLALDLRSRGVRAGATVAVCLARGTGSVVAPLAVWKAGGVYLPLDPAYPAERLSFLLRDSGASHVLTESGVAGVLPEHEAEVVLMDGAALSPLAGHGEHDLASEPGGNDLAYLIYTSGSTGTPKAVMVEHAQFAHTLRGALEVLGLGADDVVPALASVAFDISLLELFTPLLAGGAVRIVPHDVVRDPETLVEATADVTVLHAVPALMRQVVEVVRGGRMLPSLRLLLVGGDSVPPDLLEDMREVFPDAQTVVLYGPTEATIICAAYAVPAEGVVAGHPLGRPLPGVRLAVRGLRGEMSPVGVPGEVWISGGGVARGYLGRPELNAEKFVGAGTERAYRTGDRARWRADGVLEFLGRADEQVKVRGFRIEPGEVEAVLRGQPGVREAVVLAREDAPGDRRLVAYVVPGADGVETAGGGSEQVSEWETLFDDTYAQDEGEEDPTLALKGWNSSYTGEPIPREEMRAWVEDTTERILALRPERVLEVGCGTGLLLFRVAPHTRAYHGTDFSGVALEHIRRHAAGLPQVSLAEHEADDLAEFAGAGFDTVVVNSVAQYFPDLDYLLRVLEGAAAALRPGGRIFVGDVRSLPLAGAFHASVELARAPEGLPIEQLRARVRRGMAEEQELLLDPALFEAVRARMPRLGRVEVQVKRGEYDNEVSRFRYDVVLHLDADVPDAADVAVRKWSGEDAEGLRALAEGNASALLVRGVPDARVREHVRAYELVSAGGEATDAAGVRALAARDTGGIAPEALFALADELARGVEVRPGASGTLDVLFHPAAAVARFPTAVDAERPWESYANDPQWGRRMRALVPALRKAARARLPEYMVPSAFVVLESFPVTANGKVDRGALPAPDTPGSRGSYVAPRTPAEERMAGIWAQVLGVERVGAQDHFFDLGGHSLLATQLVSRVREAFRTELPLRAVFEAPTLAGLTGRVEALRAETLGDAGAPPLVPVPRDGSPLPLSFAQERLWFIDRLEPGSATYNLPAALRLTGALDERALERTLSEIVRRHEALRTVFAEVDGSPVQVIAPFGGFALPVEDLSGLSKADREAAVRRRAGEEAWRPFDLSTGPLFRAALLRLGDEDHVLLLSMHHIVSDGWSMGVLFRELSALYAAYREGGESPLPELAVQYADYAVWQREQLEGEVLDRQLSYWRERLAGAPELLELPTDHPRPPVQTHQGATVPMELSLDLLERLQALGRSEGATLYMTLLGAFQVLLSRYGGSEDIVVGSPIAGRTRGEVEGLIGFFVNTLVLRTDLGGDPSFREVLGRVREATLGAYAHQELPFERLVAELQPERSLSHSPLFQVMFALQNGEDQGGALPGLKVGGVGAAMEIAKFDLFLTLSTTAQGLQGALNYSTDLFERGTIERMLSHLARVLEQVAADADVRLSRLDLVGEAERARLLALGEGAAPEFPRATVDALFAHAAATAPEAVALAWDGGRMTYAELDGRANRLAHHLRRAGVAAGTRVGVCLERGPEMVVATLAALKAGGAYVPLDPAYPAERLAFMLADTAVPVLVTESSLADRLPAHAARVVRVDADAAAIAAEPADAPAAGTDPEAAAYVMYTSGSTGRPKGVEVPHRAIVRLVRGQDYVSIDPSDVFLQLAPASFDAATLEVWGPLLNGARLAIHPAEQPTVESIGQALAEHGVTVLWLTAGLFHLVVEERIEVLRGVRQLLAGGDVLSVPHVRRVLEELPETALINGYGPTENTTFTCCHRIGEAPRDGGSIPVGRPIANTYVRVLDAEMQPTPVGVPGELYAGGAGLALGYVNRPKLTAEKFVADPFAAGARLYRTGDRVRWRKDGTVEFLGRVDTQVKIRGFRIEPGEIEAVLSAHTEVREARVIVWEDAPGEKRLVAYLVGGAEADELREHVRRSLPEYMLPAAFVFMDALPLTPNGKLDRKALPAPELAAAEDRYVAPRTPVEEVLAGIWAEVLRLERVGVEESFFELGGHSLLATRVVSRIREVFAVELPLRALFEGPTVADLAGRVEEMRRAELPVLPPVVPAGRTGPLPLSFAQERLWFIDRLEPGSATYNLPASLRLAGALDGAALERALAEIVRRHEALRTVFAEVDGSPVQVVAPFGGFAMPVEDLSALSEADREAAVRRRTGEEARRPFDLSAGPLLRAALLRLGEEDHVLLLSMHHIVSDGWSTGVLFRELSTLYAAYREGRESPLPELGVQYADYAVWQREHLRGEVLDRQLAYWRERLADAPALLELPTDRPRPAVQTDRGAMVPVEFSLELLERLQALGRSEGATLYMTLLGAFQVLLSKYAGSEDIVVGSPIAGRTRKEVEELIGFFVNTLVLRTDVSGDPPFREVLRRVREATLGAYEHQELPFEKLVVELQPERSLSHSPLFQVMFALQDAEGGGGALPGLKASGVGAELASARFDLSLEIAATPHGLRGGLIYRADLFEPGTVERMLRYLERVLEQVAADVDVRPSQLDLLGEAERARVLEEGSRTAAEVPADRCIHELFQAQAARTPDAVAVTFGAESVTYAQLDARANGLAHLLLERGARPDSLVGLLVERSVETVVGILGILKAGAGYLPLDPADPDDRLAWVLEDSGAPIIVTTSTLAPRLGSGGVEIVRLDSEVAESPAAPAVDVAPGSLAYVIYTSGSTGRPKGVQVTHANVVRLFAATDPWFGFGAQDVWTLFHSYAFDFSVWEIWGALLYGGRLVVVPFQVSRSPEEFYALLEAERVTVLNQTPSAFRQLMRADEEAAERGEMRGLALRYVVFGGEALDPAILRGWVDRRGDGRPLLVNMYGITETTVHVTYRVVRQADVRGGSSSPIGIPIPDLSVHLLDRNGQLVPTGMVGEMYVGGGGVARGYLHRPELTAERFVRDPFSADPAARLYRSGDLARRRADGSLEFMGRADDQVKVRGFRIELREIESVLLDHPAVRDTVVLTRGEGEEKRLVAWFVAAGEVGVSEVGAAELRAHLLAHLPGHMVPSAFVRLDALPLTRNGKVDRRALPEPDAGDLAGTHFVAPATQTEEVLANLWAQLLGAERVGATDDFFMLGGHSLLATRLASRVRSDLRVELPIRAVFEHSTLGALAAEVDRLRRGAAGVEAPPVVPVPRDGDLPLSLAQERLWFADRMEPGSATYHMPLFVRLEGELDEDAFRRALDELVRRHESLRTSFPLVDGFPVQRVAPPAPAEVTFHDLSALRDDERQDEAARLVREQARTPFWLETGPLFRADLVRLGEGVHLFLATLHHVITDGWSLDVLWHELAALYGSFSRGEASPLPEPRIQYGDFAVWQRAWLQGEVLERQVAFWRRTLEGAPPLLELPADRPRPPVQTHNGAVEPGFLSREVTDAVLALARQEGATLFMVLLAALDLVLSRQSGQLDVVVGTPIAGRTRAETDRVVGLFLNSLALRVSLADDPAFRELLRRVRDTTLDAYAHQDAPFEAVLEEIQPERALDRTPVFQVMLNLANFIGAGEVTAAAEAPSGFAGLRVHGVDHGAGTLAAKFDFTLYADERPAGIGLHLVYNSNLFDAARMAALLAQVVAVLKQAVEDPGRPVSRFVLADGRAPSGADRELRTVAGLPAGVGEPGEVWERRDGRWVPTGERGRYLPDGSIAAASATPIPEARTEPAAPAPDAGAALTETEREMLAIWHEVLGEPVELHDDFFELGGHSLLGVRLLALVKKRLGRTLALPVLFGASTPALLSAQVDDTGEGRGFVHLVPMGGEESELEPIFLVHPAGGTVFKYADLARHLGDERPIYAIQAAGVTDGAEPLRTVDLMAQAYLEEVLRLQPQGPYYLAGWSAGGVIVMEMAHRLRAAGHEVALAGLLDTSPPNAEKPVPDPVHLYRRLAAGLSSADLSELDALEDEMRGLAIDDRLPYLARWLAAHGAESRVHELDGLKPVVEVFRANVAATRRHPLAPYPGRVTLFCAEVARGEGWEKADLPGLWKPFVSGQLEVVVVPGSHITMVNEPHVRGVAAAIEAAMGATMARS